MVANFLNSRIMSDEYDMTFSFRASSKYQEGLNNRLRSQAKTYPLILPQLTVEKNITPRDRTTLKKILDYLIYLFEYMPITILDFMRLRKVFKEISPDILHINNGGYPGSHSCRVSVLAAKSVGVRMDVASGLGQVPLVVAKELVIYRT